MKGKGRSVSFPVHSLSSKWLEWLRRQTPSHRQKPVLHKLQSESFPLSIATDWSTSSYRLKNTNLHCGASGVGAKIAPPWRATSAATLTPAPCSLSLWLWAIVAVCTSQTWTYLASGGGAHIKVFVSRNLWDCSCSQPSAPPREEFALPQVAVWT